MPALIDQSTHDEIFEMRKNGLSYQKIADALSLNKGQVARELKKPATSNGDATVPGHAGNSRSAYEDPILAAAAARLEAKKIELQEKQLDRQLALLDGKSGGGEAGMTMVLLNQMQRMQEDVDRKLAMQAPAKPAEDPMHAMVRGMGLLAELQQKAAILAPPPAVPAAISPEHVELRVLMEKLNIETETVRQRAAAEAERNQFLFSMAKENLPMIIAGVKTFFESASKRQEQAPVRPTLTVLPGGETVAETNVVTEVPMTCATCASKFMVRPEEGELPTCTVCGGPLQPDVELTAPATPKPFWPEDATFG